MRAEGSPSNPTYATDPTEHGVVGDESTRLIERVLLRLLTEQRAEAPLRDGRLAVVAAWAASRSAQTQLSSDELDEVARRAGHVGPTPAVVMMQGRNLTEASVRPLLEKAIETFPTNLPLTRYAILGRYSGSSTVYAIVLASLELTLRPVPKHMTHDETLHLAGALADRFERTRLAVTLPEGDVRTFEHAGRDFAVDLRLYSPGVYRVELFGDGRSGPVVVANFPVYVDIDEPAPTRHTAPGAAEVGALTAARLEERLLALLNAARAEAHVAPVRSDDELAAVARSHSQDMADHGFFGHVSPTTGTPADRVHRGRLTGLVRFGENVALGTNAEEAHSGLMGSPGHRANMLQAEYTHVGIGAVLQARSPGQPAFEVTYLFAQRGN